MTPSKRRVRCQGPCRQLYDRDSMGKVLGEWWCQDCVTKVAHEKADETRETAEGKRERIAVIRTKHDLSDPQEPAPILDTCGSSAPVSEAQEGEATAARDDPVASPVTMQDTRGATFAVPASEVDTMLALNWSVYQASSSPGPREGEGEKGRGVDPPAPLPAPTTQPSVTVDLGDPDDALERRRDLPDAQIPGWPLRRGRISASAIGTFMKCPELFRRRYIVGMKEPGTGSMITGSAVHTAIEVAYKYRMEGQSAPEKVWKEWLHAKIDHEIADAEKQGATITWGRDERANEGFVRERALTTAYQYLREVVPMWIPETVETSFAVDVSGCPVPVVGITDLVGQPRSGINGVAHPSVVVDWKCGRTASQVVSPEWRIQGMLYLLGYDMDMTWHSISWPKKDGSCTIHTPHDAAGLILHRTALNYRIARRLVAHTVADILAMARRRPDGPWQGALTHTYACSGCAWRYKDCAWWTGEQPTLEEWIA